MSNKDKNLNPFEQVLEISEIAREKEWESKENIQEDEQTIKKIINKPTKIENHAYNAYLEFFDQKKDDDLS